MSAEFLVPFALLVSVSCTCGIIILIQSRRETTRNFSVAAQLPIEVTGPNPARSEGSLSCEDQWSRVMSLVSDGLSSMDSARGFQAEAEQQLDAAQYALKRIVAELSGVMTVSRETPVPSAIVHRLPRAVRPARRRALAA